MQTNLPNNPQLPEFMQMSPQALRLKSFQVGSLNQGDIPS